MYVLLQVFMVTLNQTHWIIFLADFINEEKILKNDGLVVTSNKTITVSIKCFVCDAPARAFLKCVLNHIGYSSCERCEKKRRMEWKSYF